MLPAIVVMLIVIAYPIYYTIDLSFFNTPPSLQLRDKKFVGIDNYSLILKQRRVLARHGQHIHMDDLRRPCSRSSWGWGPRSLCNDDFAGRGVLRAIFIIPWVISAVAASYIWKWIYHSDFGVIGAVLVALGHGRPST